MTDVRPLNAEQANYPVDMVHDHEIIEVKSGLVSNGEASRHWRVTLGEPGDEEKAKMSHMTPDERAAHNARKMDAAMGRKERVLREISTKLGKPISSKTITVVIDPDRHRADVFVFDGFHPRITWDSEEAQHGYVATVKYGAARTH